MKKVKQLFTLFFLSLLSVTAVFAQKTITGVVTDGDSKEALIGASVIVKGTNTGALTDENGKYSLSVPANATILTVSFVGYTTQEVGVGTEAILDVKLSPAGVLDNVVVIGSRSNTARTSTESSVPVDVLTAKDLKGFSQVDVGQILNYVAPSFNSNRQTVTDGTDHLDPASLRGLGPDQVLVLVNGKRRHTSALVNINGSVGRGSVGTDMNVIPVAAIERIEVLRDGAAAQYGSDAIAGVINIVLKNNYEGISASVTTGLHVTNMKYAVPTLTGGSESKSQKLNDGQVIQVDVNKGFRLGKTGALTVGAAYNQRGKTNRSGEDNAPTIYLGSAGGFPSTPTGQVQNDFRTKLIADDATLVKQNNYNRQNMIFGNSTSRNMGVFFNGKLPTNEQSELYFSGGITYRDGKGYGNNRVPVSRGQQPLNADGSLLYPNGFLPAIQATIQDQSLIAGYKTQFGNWRFDASNTFGQNAFRFDVEESGNASSPNGNAQKEFYAGKLQFRQNTTNVDISRTYDQVKGVSGLNLAFGGEFRYENYRINAGEEASYSGANANKTVPTAPLTIGGAAAGSTLALPGAQVFPGFQPNDAINKSRTSQALYADVEGELFSRLLLGVAGRFENFSDFGTNLSGKISARLKLTEGLALRGSASTGFRAPSLHQRYFQNTSTQFVSGLPSNTLTVNNENPISREFIGVAALKPETSIGFTGGVTASFGKLAMTLDVYQIEIKDRIVYSGAFSRALMGWTATQYVGVNNVNFFANAANTRTQGIDIVASYRLSMGKGVLNTSVAANFNKNEVTAINSTPLISDPARNLATTNPGNRFQNLIFDRQQRSRIEVLQPLNKWNVSANYAIGKLNLTLRAVRFGESTFLTNVYTEDINPATSTFWNTQFSRDGGGKAYIDQTFKAIWHTDLVVGYNLTEKINLSIGANNLFDVYPDQIYIDPRNATNSLDYNSGRDASNRGRFLFQPNQGGFNGRFLFARLAANF